VPVHLARGPVVPVHALELSYTLTDDIVVVVLLDGALGATVPSGHGYLPGAGTGLGGAGAGLGGGGGGMYGGLGGGGLGGPAGLPMVPPT